jgi:hypothetical protein
MNANDRSELILKTEYLYNNKTGNGFVVRSQVVIKEKVINTLPAHLSDDLINDVLNGERVAKLRSFKLITVEKTVPGPESLKSIDTQNFPPAIFSSFILKNDYGLKNFSNYIQRVNSIKRDKPTMAHAEVTFREGLEGQTKTVFEYSVISRLLFGEFAEGDFISKTEKMLITNFEKMSENNRKDYYDDLKKKVSLISG